MNSPRWRLPTLALAAWLVAGVVVFAFLVYLYLEQPPSQSSEDLLPFLALIVAGTFLLIWLTGVAFFAAVWAITRPGSWRCARCGAAVPGSTLVCGRCGFVRPVSSARIPMPIDGSAVVPIQSAGPGGSDSAEVGRALGEMVKPRFIHGRVERLAFWIAVMSGILLGDAARSSGLYALVTAMLGVALAMLLLRLPDRWLMPWMLVMRRLEDDRRAASPSTADSAGAAEACRELAAALAEGRDARRVPHPDLSGLGLEWGSRLAVWRWAIYPVDVMAGVALVTFAVLVVLQ